MLFSTSCTNGLCSLPCWISTKATSSRRILLVLDTCRASAGQGTGARPCHNFSARTIGFVGSPAPAGSSSPVRVSLGRSCMLNRWFPAFVTAKPSFPVMFSVFVLSSQRGTKMSNLSEVFYTFSVLFLYIVASLS